MRTRRTTSRSFAVTLVELVVVLAIIGLLLGLLMPAVQSSRARARRTGCESNLHQLAIAMVHFHEARNQLPEPAPDGAIGGWAVALLPFMEDSHLADGLSGNPPLDPAAPLDLTRKRPPIMTCPSGYDGDSSVATVPVSHYSAIIERRHNPRTAKWSFGELQTDSRLPWVTSPEVPFGGPVAMRPHEGGYNVVYGSGPNTHGVRFFRPDD